MPESHFPFLPLALVVTVFSIIGISVTFLTEVDSGPYENSRSMKNLRCIFGIILVAAIFVAVMECTVNEVISSSLSVPEPPEFLRK